MIVYDLACSNGHRFEGWFASSGAYARQHDGGLVTCPMCDDRTIERIPSARVSVSKSPAPSVRATNVADASKRAVSSPPTPAASTEAIAGLTPEMLVKLREIVSSVENVGRRFPEEARKIHYEEVPARPIRGQASADEARELADEGIEFAPLPPFLTESH